MPVRKMSDIERKRFFGRGLIFSGLKPPPNWGNKKPVPDTKQPEPAKDQNKD